MLRGGQEASERHWRCVIDYDGSDLIVTQDFKKTPERRSIASCFEKKKTNENITGEYDLPEEIQGIKVLGWNGEFLLGVPLENNFQYETLKLSKDNVEHEVRQWIKDVKWDLSIEQISSIKKFVSD